MAACWWKKDTNFKAYSDNQGIVWPILQLSSWTEHAVVTYTSGRCCPLDPPTIGARTKVRTDKG